MHALLNWIIIGSDKGLSPIRCQPKCCFAGYKWIFYDVKDANGFPWRIFWSANNVLGPISPDVIIVQRASLHFTALFVLDPPTPLWILHISVHWLDMMSEVRSDEIIGIRWITTRAKYQWTHGILMYINIQCCVTGRNFSDDIFKCIFLNENVWIFIKISLMFVPKGLINNIPALYHMMAWCMPGDKPLSEPMMVTLSTHLCVTLPQIMNTASVYTGILWNIYDCTPIANLIWSIYV